MHFVAPTVKSGKEESDKKRVLTQYDISILAKAKNYHFLLNHDINIVAILKIF